MKTIINKRIMWSLAAMGLLVAALLGIRAASKHTRQPELVQQSSAATNQNLSPTDQRIRTAQNRIEQAPAEAVGYNLLASAYTQKARETGDFSFNAKAEEALARSFEVEPDNYEALKLRAKLLLTFHKFSEALEVARRAQSLRPQDHDVYGALTDALVELGEYEAAVQAAQTMVNMRPDTASYSRVSYLRELYGDTEGAIETMLTAVKAASPQDPENLAWCRVQLGNLLLNAGRLTEAEREFDRALLAFPDYHLALAAKARARLNAGDTGKAIEFYRRAIERVPLPDYSIALGDLYTKLGQTEEAQRQYALVEFVERAGTTGDTYSRLLALFWADHDVRLDDALAAAERERAARRDIYTSDALAWCLYKKGRLPEARAAIDEALRLGTRDARMLYHAGLIYKESGERQKAANYLKLALQTNAAFDVLQADTAQRALNAINT